MRHNRHVELNTNKGRRERSRWSFRNVRIGSRAREERGKEGENLGSRKGLGGRIHEGGHKKIWPEGINV